jgi:hypothetical protein
VEVVLEWLRYWAASVIAALEGLQVEGGEKAAMMVLGNRQAVGAKCCWLAAAALVDRRVEEQKRPLCCWLAAAALVDRQVGGQKQPLC